MSEYLGQDEWIREYVPTKKDSYQTYMKKMLRFPEYMDFAMMKVSSEEVEYVAKAFDIIKTPHSQGDGYVVQVIQDLVFLIYSEEWSGSAQRRHTEEIGEIE